MQFWYLAVLIILFSRRAVSKGWQIFPEAAADKLVNLGENDRVPESKQQQNKQSPNYD